MYSYSKIQCFFNCPMMFRLRYLDKVKVERFESIEAFMGGRVHEALEKLYKDQMHHKENSLDDISGFYNTMWQKKYSDAVQVIKKQYTADNYFDMGRKYIEDYYLKHSPFAGGMTVGLEEKITLKLKNHTILGYIDRLSVNKDNTYEIHDYKTSASMPHKAYFDTDEQLALYAIGVKNRYEDAKKVKLVWHYLAFNKAVEVFRTDNELEATKDSVTRKIGVIEDAQKKSNFLPNESKLCLWCEYQRICPVKKHRFLTDPEPKEAEKESAAELADHYAHLKNKQSEINEKIEVIRNRLIEYSKKNNLSAVDGKEHTVKVNESKELRYPRAGEDDRKKLEEYLRNVKLWEKVSVLDAHALNRLMKETLVDRKIAEKIRSFAEEEITYKVTIGKKRKEED
ncbi:MAG: PD-(D/E)XK nuclease family protein [archaeon]